MQVAPPKVQIFSSLANYYSSFFCFSSMPSPFLPGNTAFSMRKIRINLYTGNYLEYFLWFSLKIGCFFDFTGRYFNIPGSFRAKKTAFRPWFLPSKKNAPPTRIIYNRVSGFCPAVFPFSTRVQKHWRCTWLPALPFGISAARTSAILCPPHRQWVSSWNFTGS